MKQYNAKKPLIAIHVPKTAGTSFREVLQEWYGSKLHLHYYNPTSGVKPKKARLKKLFSNKYRERICIYGHFPQKKMGLGIISYYAGVDQFITILRDPFDRAVSSYFHKKSAKTEHWKDNSNFQVGELENYLATIGNNSLNHFPFEVTQENYKEQIRRNFIHIGIQEDLGNSIKCIAKKLGFATPKNIRQLNTGKKTQGKYPELRRGYIDRHLLEYAVYDFAVEYYNNK